MELPMQTTLISPYGLAAPFGTKKTVPLDGTGELELLLGGGVDAETELAGALVDEAGDDEPLAGVATGVVVDTEGGADDEGTTESVGEVVWRISGGIVVDWNEVVAFGADDVGAGADVLGSAVAALADAAEADDDCAAAAWSTPFWENTGGCEPDTSWPTRLTAVNVTAVTRAQDMIQPRARPSDRPDHARGKNGKARTPAKRRGRPS